MMDLLVFRMWMIVRRNILPVVVVVVVFFFRGVTQQSAYFPLRQDVLMVQKQLEVYHKYHSTKIRLYCRYTSHMDGV